MYYLIWKSLLHRKLSTMASSLGVAVGVAIIFAIIMLYSGVMSGLELSQQRMGADIVVIPGGATMEPSLILFSGAPANIYLPASTIDSIRDIPGVSKATPQFFTHTLTADCCDISAKTRLIGYDPASDWLISPWLKTIRKEDLQAGEVILGAKVPDFGGEHMGILGHMFSIAGVLEETGTSLDYSLLVNMADARQVAADSSQLQPIWTKNGNPDGLISAVLVKVAAGADVNAIESRIRQSGDLQPIVAAEVKQRINSQFAVLASLLGGTGLLVLLAAMVQLFARFYTLTWDRQAEWGLYLALGAVRRDIAVIIIGEAVAGSALGSAVGILFGGGLYKIVLALLIDQQSFPFSQPSGQFILTLSVLIITSISLLGALAAGLPAYRGSRIEPGTIMTRGEFD